MPEGPRKFLHSKTKLDILKPEAELFYLFLYLTITVIGYFIGAAAGKRGAALSFAKTLQTPVVILLVFVMGSRIGSNDELVRSLGDIGLAAFIHVLIVLAVTTLAFTIARRTLGFDRFGRRGSAAEEIKSENADKEKGHALNSFTLIIIVTVALGILAGWLVLPKGFIDITGTLLTVILCIFLLLIGIDTGAEGALAENFKTAGFRILLFPFISIAAMGIAAFIAAPILGLSIKDSLCVGCGMGWYSLAPAMIADYSLKISAIAFIHNVLREIISIILIPVVADKLGFIESYGLGGATGMDVTLPVVARATSSEVAMYSFISGAVVSASVPVITSIVLAL